MYAMKQVPTRRRLSARSSQGKEASASADHHGSAAREDLASPTKMNGNGHHIHQVQEIPNNAKNQNLEEALNGITDTLRVEVRQSRRQSDMELRSTPIRRARMYGFLREKHRF